MGVATAAVRGGTLTLRGVAEGRTTLTLTATDPGGLSASQSAAVTVTPPPPGPETVGAVPDRSIEVGDAFAIDMASYFTHPGGLSLAYAASTSDAATATAGMTGSTLAVEGLSDGTATITVAASDPNGRSAEQSFSVSVGGVQPPSGFDIELVFAPGTPASVQSAMNSAAQRWESIVAATDFPDVEINSSTTCGIGSYVFEVPVGSVDDVKIGVGTTERDGEGGIAASATLCLVRQAGGEPVIGVIVFDSVDVDWLASTGVMLPVAVHEVAHVLGIGLLAAWNDAIVNPSLLAPSADSHFPGSAAVAAFDAAGGSAYTGGKVPTQNRGDDSHWRQSVIGGEVMGPAIGLGPTPLSAITIQALADLGYTVNAALADAYTLPSGDIAGAAAADAPVIDLSHDVYRGPIMHIDTNGDIVRVTPGAFDDLTPQRPPPGGAAAQEDSVNRITIDARRPPDGPRDRATRRPPP